MKKFEISLCKSFSTFLIVLIFLLIGVPAKSAIKREVKIKSFNCYQTTEKYSTGLCRLEIYVDQKLADAYKKTIKRGDVWKIKKSYNINSSAVIMLWHENSKGSDDFLGYVYIDRDIVKDTNRVFLDFSKNTPKWITVISKKSSELKIPNGVISDNSVPGTNYSISYTTIGEPESHYFDVFIPGQLWLKIEPQAAVDQGGQYKLNDGDWVNSEQLIQGIKPGQYLLSFKKLDKWDVPKSIPIYIPGGKVTQMSVTYNSLPVFSIGSIPPQTIWQGDVLRFLVNSGGDSPGLSITISTNPQPKGEILFNSNSGLFSYSPSLDDKDEFKVTFQTNNGSAQTISINPLNRLVAEADVFDYSRPLPDPESRDFIVVHKTKNPRGLFNNDSIDTYDVTISGPTIIFEKGSSKNDLFEDFNEKNDIRAMQIFAENVIIRSPLHLPQTNITIHARTLKFEDSPKSNPGSAQIITTPAKKLILPGVGENGENGVKAGNISLFIESYSSGYYTDYMRFNLTGGNGQSAGMGQNGSTGGGGAPMDSRPIFLTGGATESQVWYRELDGSFSQGEKDPNSEFGKWPEDGGNAIPSGKPGNGGPGGDVQTTLDISPLIDNTGGYAGARGGNIYYGGKAQSPIISYGAYRVSTSDGNSSHGYEEYDVVVGPHQSNDGKNFTAPFPDVPIGMHGNVAINSQQLWISPLSFETILAYLREAYIDGQYDFVELTCNKFLSILAASEGKIPDNQIDDFNEIEQEFTNMRQRVENNFDYFGNPAGWTPMLSFEANKLAFETEINEDIPILYLTYWLGDAAAKAKDAKEALTNTLNTINTELPNKISQFNQIQVLLPSLLTERSNLLSRIHTLEVSISNREQELLAIAKDNLQVEFWRTGLRIIGSVLKVCPVYQPALGAIGTGLDLLSNIDADKPLESLWESRDILKEYDADLLTKTANDFGTKVKEIQQSNNTDLKKSVKELQLIGKSLAPAIDGIKKALQEQEVPQSEIEAELQRLKASDTVFVNLSNQAKQYTQDLAAFIEKMSKATNELCELMTDIQTYLLAKDAIRDNLADLSEKLNPRALSYIKIMERRTKDRLLEYQYIMAKAYNYRMLTPYDGDMNLNRLFEKFITLGEDNKGILSDSAFTILKGVYEEELRRITEIILKKLNAEAPERSVPITVGLSQEEIKKLNKEGQVQINLVDKKIFGKTEENLRLVNIKTKKISVHPISGSYGSTAILRINIMHTGLSLLSSKGKTYLFKHYRTESINPITWKSVFDGITGITTETKISAASESLLHYLLGESASGDLLLYSRPAAWADLLIKKEVNTDNGIDMGIDSLRFEVEYDYYEKPTNQVELTVTVQESIDPNVLLTVADINGRKDGRGSFRRVFNKDQIVKLQAQPTYGKWKFEKWTDKNGNTLSSGNPISTLEIKLDDDKEVKPNYVWVEQ